MALLTTLSHLLAVISWFTFFALSIADPRGECTTSEITLTFDKITNLVDGGRQELPNPWTYPNQPFTFTQPRIHNYPEPLLALINSTSIQPRWDFRAVACAASSPNCFEARYGAPTLEITAESTKACRKPLFDVKSFNYYSCPIDSRKFNITTYDSKNKVLTTVNSPPHSIEGPYSFVAPGGEQWENLKKLVLSAGSQPFRTGGACGLANGLFVDNLKFSLRCNC